MTDYYKPSVKLRVALPFMTLLFVLLLLVACDGALKTKITVKVIDEDGSPINRAKVRVGYYLNDPPKNGHGEEGFTNIKGELTSTGKSHGYVTFLISKPGYYNSSGSYSYSKKSGFSWEPENPKVELVLRKK